MIALEMCGICASLVHIAALVAIWAPLANCQPPDTFASAGMAKVLLIQDAAKQRAIEEAAALSLDTSATKHGAEAGDNARTQSWPPRTNNLASLTLYQNHKASSSHVSAGAKQRSTRQESSADTNNELPGGAKSAGWRQVQMARIKPSWLNVSSRFKISATSIEDLSFMVPAEFLMRQAFDSSVLLKTRLGVIEGIRSITFNKHLYTFLGVPYARAPIEQLRFQAPRPALKWDGIYQATKWAPFCVQPSMTLASQSSPVHVLSQVMSEDCLYLNIWTPSLRTLERGRAATAKRPVMVWIHGGSFQYGGASVDENDGSALALLGDVVVVTLNYRLSAFGFLNANNPDAAPNNVGLLDQRMALQWVRDNIKHFGGDPQQVTLFGESAGGHSIGLHMISPASQPLFRRAILQSGVPTSYLRSYDSNPDNEGPIVSEAISSIMMAKRLNCYTEFGEHESHLGANDTAADASMRNSTGAENEDERPQAHILDTPTVDCLRTKSSLELLKAMGAPRSAGFFPTGDDKQGFFPHGSIMDAFDADSLRVGPQKDYLLGTNTDEGSFFLHYGLPSIFPARAAPTVANVTALKQLLRKLVDQPTEPAADAETNSNNATNSKLVATSATSATFATTSGGNSSLSELRSASGSAAANSAQAHLFRPLMRLSTEMIENFMRPRPGELHADTSKLASTEAKFGKSIAGLISDIIFLCPARRLARTLAEAGKNVYFYLYEHRSSLSQYHEWIGVTHHDEVEFVFGRPLRLADVYSGRDIEMSQRLIKAWAHFAHTGKMPPQLDVEWPKYDSDKSGFMRLTADKAATGQRYHDRVCNIYETVILIHLQDA